MIRFLDSLAGTLAGLLIGVLLMFVLVDTVPLGAAPRAALQADPTSLPAGTTTDAGTVPSPDFAGQRGQPDPKAVIPAPTVFDGAVGRITPSPAIGMRPAPAEEPRTASTLRGIATWFHSPAGVSAAGPDLRAALGPGWRGTSVRVCSGSACIVTVLGDWMRADRLIDLHAPLFARLAPLSVGVLRVVVTPIPAPPVTSTTP